MKQYIKSSNFETRVCLVDKYGDVVFELEFVPGKGYYKIPEKYAGDHFLLDVDDLFSVEEIGGFEVD